MRASSFMVSLTIPRRPLWAPLRIRTVLPINLSRPKVARGGGIAKIWTLCLSTTALCCHCDDVVAANHEDTLVLDQVAVSHEESPPVDVEDFALSTFTAVFLDIVVVSDLGTVAVCCYSVLVPVDHLRYLGVEECANVALLIDYTQDFAIDSNDTTDG
jgi:hypothetical protein